MLCSRRFRCRTPDNEREFGKCNMLNHGVLAVSPHTNVAALPSDENQETGHFG